MNVIATTQDSTSLWDEHQAASYLRVCVQTLRKDRTFKHHLKVPFLRIGGRVVYRKSDLDKWLDHQVVNAVGSPAEPASDQEQPLNRGPGRPRKQALRHEITN